MSWEYDWVNENNRFLKSPEDYLNNATFCQFEPVFDTPELPRNKRIELYKYLHHVRKQVHKNAAQRAAKNFPIIRHIAKYIVSTELFLNLFYQSVNLRKFIDKIRFKPS